MFTLNISDLRINSQNIDDVDLWHNPSHLVSQALYFCTMSYSWLLTATSLALDLW